MNYNYRMKLKVLFYIKIFLIIVFIGPTSYAKGPDSTPIFLPPDEAFIVSLENIDDNQVRVSWKIAEGYYLYVGMFEFSSNASNSNQIEKVKMPDGIKKKDEFFGDVDVFYNQAIADIFFESPIDNLELTVKYQGCAEAGLCYPPVKKTFDLNSNVSESGYFLKTSSANDQISISNHLANQSFFLNIIFFYVAGILLAFTPCVFPMIPILTGIIVGQGNKLNTKQAFLLSLTYVFSMSLTYAAIGMVVASSGVNIQANLQDPVVIIMVSIMFIILALAMFGLIKIQMPSSIQNFLTQSANKRSSGTFFGVGIMGSLSALIVGPCVTAPLIGALIYISTTHDYIIGGAVLFSLGLGMGTPLLVLGASASKIIKNIGQYLPLVNKIFGVLFLIVALWMLERILSISTSALLWTGLSLLILFYLLKSEDSKNLISPQLSKFLSVLVVIYTGLQLFGISNYNSYKPYMSFIEIKSNITFVKIYESDSLYKNINNANKITMIDLYADWCVACKELEQYTFTDPKVEELLLKINLIKYDITSSDLDSADFLSKFQLYGPPAILFFNKNGKEIEEARIVGFVDAQTFLQKTEIIKKNL